MHGTPPPRLPPSADIPAGMDNPLNYAVQQRDRDVLQMVADALRHDEVLLAYQPIVESRRQDHIAFYEGLVRILDATGREIPAAQFMPQVEDRTLGREIDCTALRLGLQALANVPGLRLSINMSARSIGYAKWLRVLDEGLRADPSAGARLILEITESSAMTVPELVRSFMAEMRRLDLAFALDDFGAGATAFRYLRDFRFDMVKIDRQFCHRISTQPDNQTLVRAMVMISEQFEMMTIAEGIEEPADAEWLSAAGLHCLQGYHFGYPRLHPHWHQDQCEKARA
ncbi:Cyclic di-GMP phosphodiesterase Gmr [Thalassovita autumnalis]|uniref:Cyclic di-GMP phosphodiesterase Gmr n=1 Tax=Thalassovita autumnalis TaxID=2072972 RepID=A0A0P1FY28_9RHOB|nr:EAL domain-containing protein [Thalassovita autumnalis]CUH67513.1 Cyclic di-GMP phosphodiesterase Gmr [Thalassovita autumnalis]CUH73920.1 Cyclic di-GMP phosphodiesterase Gmr [Thalassovita autumnalis]